MSTKAPRSPSEPPRQPPPPSVAAASSTNDAALRYAIDTGALGLIPWAQQYLPHHLNARAADFHWELSDLAEEEDRLAVAAPRGHAKTTLLALAFPLYRAAVHREPYTLIVSDTGTQAEQRTSDLYAELLENQELVAAYPHLALPDVKDYREKRVKRTTRDFITLGGIRFTGAGAGQSLRGTKSGHQRPSLIIADDLENDENVRTDDQRQKLRNWFLKSLSSLPGHTGARLIVIGTILHEEGLLAWLLRPDRAAVWAQRKYAALTNGVPLWPDAWSVEKLEAKLLEIGELAFATEYQNAPVPPGSRIFKATTYYDQVPDGAYREASGFDAAYTARTSADATVTITGRLIDGRIYITNLLHDRLEPMHFIPLMKAHGVTRVTWYRSGTERGLEELLKREGISVDALPATSDKLSRAIPAATAWNRGEILLPKAAAWTPTIESELSQFTGVGDAHDDIVDALSALVHALMGAKPSTDPATAETLYR